ncbi:MAG: DoxX family protein [Acidobacteria bacterium]|nr:DoxX family protein [Acidobacteriota bacterium]
MFGPGKIAVDAVVSKRFPGEEWFDRLRPVALNLLRIFTGILFWQHGASKFGFLGGRMREFPDLTFFAGVLEFFGGPLIALGAFTQPVAFILSGEMAYAFWFSHVPRGPTFWPVQNGGEMAVLFCFIYLFLVTVGPGKFSVDGLRASRVSKG